MTDQLAAGSSVPRYIETPTGYLMVLRQGDDMFCALEDLVRSERIPSATLNGFGFAGRVTFGFYNFATKHFDPGEFENVEIASMTGTLAWKEGLPSVHAHGVAGKSDFSTVGGHLLALEVGAGSLEVTITVHERTLERRIDPGIGANVLSL